MAQSRLLLRVVLLAVLTAGPLSGVLAQQGGDIDALIEQLSDDQPAKRVAAARALGARKDLKALNPLCLTRRDPNRKVRLAAAEALGQLGDPRACPYLMEFYYYHGSPPYLRNTMLAMRVLGQIGGERAARALIQDLRRECHVVHGVVLDGLARQAASALTQAGEEATPALLEGLQDKDPTVRVICASALERLAPEAAVPGLIEALQDPSADVRIVAVRALGDIAAPEAAAPIVARVSDDTSMHFRLAAASTVRALGGAALKPLTDALRAGNPQSQVWAAETLGDLGQAEAAGDLVAALSAKRSELRAAAAEALGKLDVKTAEQKLAALTEDPSEWVRTQAFRALGQIQAQATDVVAKGLQDPDRLVRCAAAEALAQVAGPAAPLVRALEDADARVQRSAALALGKLKAPEAVEPLATLLRGRDETVVAAAAEALGQIATPPAVEALAAHVRDRQATARRPAAEALGRTGDLAAARSLMAEALQGDAIHLRELLRVCLASMGAPAIPLAQELIANNDEQFQELGAAALADMACREAMAALLDSVDRKLPDSARGQIMQGLQHHAAAFVPELLNGLKHERPGPRQAAAAALRRLRAEDVLDAYAEALKDPDVAYRRQVVNLLAQRREPEAVQPLIAALDDEDVAVKVRAIHALGQLKDKAAIEPIAKLYPNSTGDLRWACLCGLGELGDPRVAPELLQIMKGNASDEVREDAAGLLGKCGDAKVVPDLVAAVEDPALRAAALYSLGQIGTPEALAVLFDKLKNEHDPHFQVMVAALGESRSSQAADWLVAYYLEDNDHHRNAGTVEYALGRLGEHALEATVRLLNDREADLRLAAAKSMVQCEGSRALGRLMTATRFGDDALDEFALDCLAQWEARERLRMVTQMALAHDSAAVRAKAARVAVQLDRDRAERAFRAASQSEDPDRAAAGAEALQAAGLEQA